ncbi:MAG: alanine--tRNA ligase [Desulfurococcaceae archaeon]
MRVDVNYEYLSKQYGYERYRCKICGEYFWSRVPRDTCPDRPCSKYEFLYKDYRGVKPLSLAEVREKFLNFLKKRGHEIVDPYPVLAKWRNDLYLTIASIVVFQPEATDGLVDPPHNPLVIIQPSIRLTDIDNVGLTFGRHLSSFEMGGMHAFNKNNKIIYWSEGIFENTIDFFTKEIGLDLDDIVFKEGWWEGGGNAGPAPEVLVDGMEVATLVHMAYKVINGKHELNPVLVVDCGYGIERITWLTQRAPTGFHSIYGKLVKEYADILGIDEPPHDVLKRIVYLLSDKELSGINDLVKQVESTEFRGYVKELVNSVYLYSTLDHIRTISLMLSDGIVPSNTGEGYLARLVIRRLIRNLVKLGVEYHRLPDLIILLVDKQVNHWKGDYIYGKFEKNREYIVDVLTTEVNKFVNNVLKGIEVVDKVIKKKKTIGVGDLIELYDSHGIPPEFIAERASQQGVIIEIPKDFYSLIASKHSSPGVLIKSREHEFPDDIVKWTMGFKETRRLFHENPYITSTSAVVLGVNGKYVVLDKTVAYPWAGGQDHDEGVIIHGSNIYKIDYVGKIGDVIVHVLDRAPEFKPGDSVLVQINWDRRYKLMKHHTATHVVLAAARRVLGEHVWQAGAEKTTEKARLDITHHKPLTPDLIKKIEDVANEIINNRINLEFNYLDRFKAEEKYGLKIHQGGAIHTQTLRIVEIPGWDAQACYGTHVFNTAEIGGVKIVNYERIQDGVVRLEFIAGTRLVDYIRELEEQKATVLSIINAKDQDLVTAIRKLHSEHQEQAALVNKYREVTEKYLIETALKETMNICNVDASVIELPLRDEKLIKSLLDKIVFDYKILTVVITGDTVEISVDPLKAREINIDLREIIKPLSIHGFKGGGKPDHVILKAAGTFDKNTVLEALRKILCRH